MLLNGLEKGYAFRLFGLTKRQILAEIEESLPEDLACKIEVTEECLDARVAVSDDATMAEKKDIIFHLFFDSH